MGIVVVLVVGIDVGEPFSRMGKRPSWYDGGDGGDGGGGDDDVFSSVCLRAIAGRRMIAVEVENV